MPRPPVAERDVAEFGLVGDLDRRRKRGGVRFLLGEVGEEVVGALPRQLVAEGFDEFFSVAASSSSIISPTRDAAMNTPSRNF